jgi:uncharacterized protein
MIGRQPNQAATPTPDAAGAASVVTTARPVRALLVTVGTLSLVLGVVGIVVPILPTTPFLLVAAACYARSSTRLSAWLLGQPSLGPIVAEWRRSRSLPPRVKTRAILVVALTFGLSILIVDGLPLRLILLAVGLALAFFLWRVPAVQAA